MGETGIPGTPTELARRRAERAERPAPGTGGGPVALPPAGTVTFLLTDIEGSTRLWETAPEAMTVATARHYDILDAAVTAAGGFRPVEQGEGDSAVAAFARASDAVHAALAAQQALTAERWPDGVAPAVRMALHTGEASIRGGVFYEGTSIIRAARLRSLAHGGQVLVSSATAALCAGTLPDGAGLVPLGRHRLRGLVGPEQVFGLVHPGLPGGFPALRSLDGLPNNLPATLSTFVGRETEQAAVAGLIAGMRLVTLVGTGGAGKSRLAAAVAGRVLPDFPDGAWWVELAPARTPEAVAAAFLDAVGIGDLSGLDPVTRICGYLQLRRALLVVDNCEHVTAAAAEILGAVLAACPGVRALATSREPLSLSGEHLWRVEPLSLPPGHAERAADLAASEAVTLFAERATEARPTFRVDDSNAAVVAALCIRLDGLPLAVELAAARVRSLTPERILDGLEQRFRLLTGATRSGLPHHQSLLASVEWSHELLPPAEQVLLRRLSVFTGPFTGEAAEAVGAGDPLDRWDVLIALSNLADRSLVSFDGTRYRVSETIRQFAAGHLATTGETDQIRDGHLAYYRTLAAGAAAELSAGPQVATVTHLGAAHDNLGAALAWALERADHDAALDLVGDLTLFWLVHGRYAESLSSFRRVLTAAPDEPGRRQRRARCGLGLVGLYSMEGPGGYGIPDVQRAAEESRAAGDDEILGRALSILHFLTLFGDPAAGLAGLDEALAVSGRAGDSFGTTATHAYLAFGWIFSRDDPERAGAHLRLLAEQQATTASPYWAAWHGLGGGLAAWRAGKLEAARSALETGVEAAWALGDPMLECWCAAWLAAVHIDRGDDAATEAVVARSLGWQDRSATCRAEWLVLRRARCALTGGDVATARSLLDALEAPLRQMGIPFIVLEMELLAGRLGLEDGDAAAARARLDAAAAIAATLATPWFDVGVADLAGRLARAAGDAGAAEDAHQRALALCARHGFAGAAAETLEQLASLAAAGESWAEAARLYGAASRLRNDTGRPLRPLDQPAVAADLARLAAELGADAAAPLQAEGAELDLAAAAAYAARARGERKRPSHGWDSLTPAEVEVVALVAEGLSNAEVGTKLFVTEGTVKVHLHHVFVKLGITRRSQLAAQATARRLAATNPPGPGTSPP